MASIQTPDWVKQAVFYQVFPDRFAIAPDPQSVFLKGVALEPWEAPPTLQGYKGGNLWGVKVQLDYLQDLGVDAIYLTPIFQATCNHRYHTHDYYQVDPLLGGNKALHALLEAAHQRRMKVILDGVFNHVGRGFFFFNDILENGPHSPWLDWFQVEGWPLIPYDGDRPANYLSWADNRALPQFNHDHPAVQEYLFQVAEHWIRQGIDGWRLDVPFCIQAPGFWQTFRQRVKAINPEAYIVGEVWGDSRPWLDGTQFDGVMNYLFTAPTIAFTAGERVVMELVTVQDYEPYPPLDAAGYASRIRELLSLYPWEVQLTQLNLLASHDTARLLSIAQGDKASVILATLLLLTFPGSPCIYYGDEVGLAGGTDPDCRRSFPAPELWDRELLSHHQELIALRRDHPVLSTGAYRVLVAQGQVYSFARTNGLETVIVAVNAGGAAATVAWQDTESLSSLPKQVLYGTGTAEWTFDAPTPRLTLRLPARSGLLLG